MSEMTRWAAPLALTRGLLVGLCVCWPSYTSAQGTGGDLNQNQTQTQDAVEATRLAAEQGDAGAQSNLGVMYEGGRGVSRDETEAVRWLRLAAEQGHVAAQANLGNMHREGRGVPRDETEAVRWFRLAAEQGDARAQYHLGFKYATGVGVSQDYVAAYMWLNLAGGQSSGDDRKAFVKGREAVAARTTSEQIADAQWLAREWNPTVEP